MKQISLRLGKCLYLNNALRHVSTKDKNKNKIKNNVIISLYFSSIDLDQKILQQYIYQQ